MYLLQSGGSHLTLLPSKLALPTLWHGVVLQQITKFNFCLLPPLQIGSFVSLFWRCFERFCLVLWFDSLFIYSWNVENL
jgi:hypothetical protein